jgi:hypothetical protein
MLARGRERRANDPLVHAQRQAINLYDATGKIIYDRELGASSLDINLSYGIGASLYSRGMAQWILERYGQEEAESRLEAVCAKLAGGLTCDLEAVVINGPGKDNPGNHYVALSLGADGNRAVGEDRVSIYSEFAHSLEGYAAHISFYGTPSYGRAKQIQGELADTLALPLTAVLGPAEPMPFKRLA